jgi:hypothetical protein
MILDAVAWLKKVNEEQDAAHKKEVAKLNRAIQELRDQIQRLESDHAQRIEIPRMVSTNWGGLMKVHDDGSKTQQNATLENSLIYHATRFAVKGRDLLNHDVDSIEHRYRGGLIVPAAIVEGTVRHRNKDSEEISPKYIETMRLGICERWSFHRIIWLANILRVILYQILMNDDRSRFHIWRIKNAHEWVDEIITDFDGYSRFIGRIR